MIYAFALLLVLSVLSILCITGRISDGSPITKILLGIDIFVCSVALGSPDMTISSRCGLALRDPHGNWFLQDLGRALNWLSTGHTTTAIENDIMRALHSLEVLQGAQPRSQPGRKA